MLNWSHDTHWSEAQENSDAVLWSAGCWSNCYVNYHTKQCCFVKCITKSVVASYRHVASVCPQWFGIVVSWLSSDVCHCCTLPHAQALLISRYHLCIPSYQKTGDGEGLGVRLVVHGHLFTVLVIQWYCTLHVDWMWPIGCPIVYGQRLQYHSHSNLWNVTIWNVDWMWPIGCPIVYGGDYNIQRNKCSQAAE